LISPTAARKPAAANHVHARNRHQPLGLRPAHQLLGDQLLDLGDLAIEERDMPERGLDRLRLIDRQIPRQRLQPLAALDAEQIRARRLALQPAHQGGVHLVLDPRAGVHQLLPASQPAPQHPGSLVGHPHRLQLPLPQEHSQRARIELG
jgi:hypothetical protein